MARITVRVTPRAGRDAIDGWRDGALRVRLSAAPADGRANDALVRLIAGSLGVAPGAVTIVHGAKSRVKVLDVAGVDDDAVRRMAPA